MDQTYVGMPFLVCYPHTLDVTTLSSLAPGAKVNLEVDLIARYVARMAEFDAAAGSRPQP